MGPVLELLTASRFFGVQISGNLDYKKRFGRNIKCLKTKNPSTARVFEAFTNMNQVFKT